MNGEAMIGFVGLGQMGGRMARRLLDGGHRVCAYDTDPAALQAAVAAGATPAASVAGVAAASDVVLLSLPGPPVVREVVLGPSGLCETGGFSCLVDLSTTGLVVAREIAAALGAAGVDVIDAPVSGGVRGAEQGSLTIMAACRDAVLAQQRPLLELLGKRIFHVGHDPGLGQAMKLVNNLVSAAAMVATAEGMVLGVKAGLDAATMLEVLNASTGRNSHTEDKFPRYVLPRTFDFGFTVGLLHKDLQLGLQMAEALGMPLMGIANAKQVWNMALALGGPEQDMTTLVTHFERWAGVEVTGNTIDDQE